MNKRYLLSMPPALFLLWKGWDKSWMTFLDMASLIFILGGTYLITKTTFVDFMLKEYRNSWENRKKPKIFFKSIFYFYCIDVSDLGSDTVAPDCEKFRRAVSFHDPFRGFVLILIGSIVQTVKILTF